MERERLVEMRFHGRKIRTLKPRKGETCKMLVVEVNGQDYHVETVATLKIGETEETRIKARTKYILDAMDAPERQKIVVRGRSKGVYVDIIAMYREE